MGRKRIEEEPDDELETSDESDDEEDEEDENEDEEIAASGETPKRKRGPQKPRDIFFICVGVIEADLVVEEIRVDHPSPKTATDDELRKLAIEAFVDKYEEEPDSQNIKGPFYIRKGLPYVNKTGRKRRASLTVDHEKVKFNPTKKSRAEYNGWKVVVQHIANQDDCILTSRPSPKAEAVFIYFKEQLSSEKKKIQPTSRFVWLRDLKNVESINA